MSSVQKEAIRIQNNTLMSYKRMPSKSNPLVNLSGFSGLASPMLDDDDDDFQVPPLTQLSQQKPLKPSNCSFSQQHRPSKKLKRSVHPGKENVRPTSVLDEKEGSNYSTENHAHLGKNSPHLSDCDSQICSLDCIQSSIDCGSTVYDGHSQLEDDINKCDEKEVSLKVNKGYLCNSIEARLVGSRVDPASNVAANGGSTEDHGFDEDTELDLLLKLCSETEDGRGDFGGEGLVQCPLCGVDISGLCEEQRHIHTNRCLDKAESQLQEHSGPSSDTGVLPFPEAIVDGSGQSPKQAVDVFPVLKWLRNMGLGRYEDAFVREEIDWNTLQWLTEEDLFSIGITALGPRKKIVHALTELRKGCDSVIEAGAEFRSRSIHAAELPNETPNVRVDESKPATSKLITDYFPGQFTDRKKVCTTSRVQPVLEKQQSGSGSKHVAKKQVKNGKLKDIPPWCCIPGTPFRVDAFKYLQRDCSHWFLTHFHMDHYQGLTRSFCQGKIYCSLITARLINMKIGIPWDRLQVLPLNETINIAGIGVTCLDANHCPGSILILFEPPNGKVVLHTGDFRYREQMASMLHTCRIHTLILDTTYCNPQYDFPKQEAVIQFVIEAIQAETFNPKTLFLIGSYTIGKERLFLEVARVLRRKVYMTAAKLRVLECLGFSEEDMQWFTVNEQESHIHVVPMWTLASFKRLKHISNLYAGRFSLIVAFSPTGWTFGKGKKKSPGRRWQQGTIIRYEVPYSEHCSFAELKEFVKLVSPERIIPSVNNDGPDSANSMISLLLA